jgi:long-subunit fatty acid transport protein
MSCQFKHFYFLFPVLALFFHPGLAGRSVANDVYHNIKGSGMANTYSGFNASADLVWVNAATLTALKNRFAISTGVNTVFNYTTFRSDNPSMYSATTHNPYYFPFHANIAYGLTPQIYVGITASSQNLSPVKWQDEDWTGRFIAREWVLSANIIQPAVAIRLADFLSLGAAIRIISHQMNFTRAIPLRDQNQEGSMVITGKDLHYNFNISAYLQLFPDFSLSLLYQPSADYHFDEALSSFITPASLSQYFPSGNNVTAVVAQSSKLEGTAAWMINDKLQLALGASWMMNKKNEHITFDFTENNMFLQDFNITSHPRSQVLLRLGAEYIPWEYLQLRAGTWYRGSSFPKDYFSPAIPDMAKFALTTGASILPYEGLSIDLGFEFITGSIYNVTYSPSNFSGSYKTYSFIPGIGIGYTF